MSKAVLVIDMPKCCKDCFRYQADPWFGGSCKQVKNENGWNKRIDADDEYNVQSWCPLRPYQEAIPIEWMKKFANERALNDGMDCYWHFWGTDLLQMIELWEKENGRS